MQFPPAKVLVYLGIWNVMLCQREEEVRCAVWLETSTQQQQELPELMENEPGSLWKGNTASQRLLTTLCQCVRNTFISQGRGAEQCHQLPWTDVFSLKSRHQNTFLPSRNGLAEHCNQKITWMKKNHDLKCFAVKGKVISDTGLQGRRCQQAGMIGFLERLLMGGKVE